jgi:hypothetical protein
MTEITLRLLSLKSRQVLRLRPFYKALGVDLHEENPRSWPYYLIGTIGNTVFEIHPLTARCGETDTTTRLGFAVEDLAMVIQTLQGLGALIDSEPRQTRWGMQALVRDPDGRTIELYQDARRQLDQTEQGG